MFPHMAGAEFLNFENLNDVEEALQPRVGTGSSRLARALHAIWEQRRAVPPPAVAQSGGGQQEGRQIDWMRHDPALILRFTERALEADEFLLVCDVAQEAAWLETTFPEARFEFVQVRMNYARALMQMGRTRDARNQIEPFAREDGRFQLGRKLRARVLELIGDIVREESHHVAGLAVRQQGLFEARGFYEQALALDPEQLTAAVYFAGVCALLGDADAAGRGAEKVLRLVRAREDQEGRGFLSGVASGAALTVLGRTDEAAAAYAGLKDLPEANTRRLAEVRYRAQFLSEAAGLPRDFFHKAFPPLQLLVFSGPAPDLSSENRRFTPEMMGPLRETLSKLLHAMDARAGLVSAAAGGDLLFVEQMLQRDAMVHLVLPWEKAEFRRDAVDRFDREGEPVWGPLFERAMAGAKTVRELGQRYGPGSETGWHYMMEVAAGLAFLTARKSRLDVQPVVLWDGRGGSAGSTAGFIDFWTHHIGLKPIEVEWPGSARNQPIELGYDRGPRIGRTEEPILKQQVKTLLFADIVGYSKLTEQVIPEFVLQFLTRVAELAATSKHAPISLDTWGDAVYAVFDTTRDAGLFALALIQMVRENKAVWDQAGLYWRESDASDTPKLHLDIRVGLHTGPVFLHYDPVVRRLGFTGAHVSRAARIEPVTRPGEIYVSEEFAALSELSAEIAQRSGTQSKESARFVCEYVGSMQLAKKYPGRHRIYRVILERRLPLEELAQAVHERYCSEAKARGETAEQNSALRTWGELPESLKEANRAQVADIPNKLRFLGYELAPLHGIDPQTLLITDAQLEHLAVREHQRWAEDRLRQGWTYAPLRNNAKKQHPLLVPWEQLSEPEKEKDRDAVRNMPVILNMAGFRLRKLEGTR
jgi:class 3 adenylate cyclase/tetratricopeptide (TPR) repeat protein